jgi:esterase/lipase superfamily enzyme
MFFKKKTNKTTIDTANKEAVLKCSICNGEQVAGFRDKTTGKFEEVMLIQNDVDLGTFKRQYGVTEIKKVY